MRQDKEKVDHPVLVPASGKDVGILCKTGDELFYLASRYETIVTNRLHFAIAGMLLRRRVFLSDNSYYKNRAMHEAWLKNLGCEWVDDS